MTRPAMTMAQFVAIRRVLEEVCSERTRQHAKWGEQNWPDGTNWEWRMQRDLAQAECERAARSGAATYMHILKEEVLEAFAEEDPAKLRAELVQAAAVAVAWVEAIDRRAP